MATELPKGIRPESRPREVARVLDGTRLLQQRPGPGEEGVHDRDPAAQRDRRASHGPRPQQHPARRAHPLAADAGASTPLWMPGTDHAGIATQAVVERLVFAQEKKTRHDLGRDELVKPHLELEGPVRGPHPRPAPRSSGAAATGDARAFTLDPVCSAGRARRPSSRCSRTATSTAASGW